MLVGLTHCFCINYVAFEDHGNFRGLRRRGNLSDLRRLLSMNRARDVRDGCGGMEGLESYPVIVRVCIHRWEKVGGMIPRLKDRYIFACYSV